MERVFELHGCRRDTQFACSADSRRHCAESAGGSEAGAATLLDSVFAGAGLDSSVPSAPRLRERSCKRP